MAMIVYFPEYTGTATTLSDFAKTEKWGKLFRFPSYIIPKGYSVMEFKGAPVTGLKCFEINRNEKCRWSFFYKKKLVHGIQFFVICSTEWCGRKRRGTWKFCQLFQVWALEFPQSFNIDSFCWRNIFDILILVYNNVIAFESSTNFLFFYRLLPINNNSTVTLVS